jgi:adenylylsulfate kinase
MIIWLTGQPGSGKTTICKEILELKDNRIFHIDGDDLRDLFDNKDYSETGRRKNIELAQQIAQYLNNKGKDVLVSLVSPYKDQRDRFKEKMGDKLIECYVHTSEVRGREDFFVKDYQPPTENFLDIDTTDNVPDFHVQQILNYAKNSR